MSTQVLGYKLLSALVYAIKTQQLSGELLGRKANAECQLYFKSGHLIHAHQSVKDIVGDEVLYELMNWDSGQLEWKPQNDLNLQISQTIDDDQESVFYNTLELLQKQGVFDPNQTSDWLNQPTPSQVRQPALTSAPARQPQLNLLDSLPLLPGKESKQLSQPANLFSMVGLVQQLQSRLFSGYVTCNSGQPKPNELGALLLFEFGKLTTARYATDHQTLVGQAAYDAATSTSNFGGQVVTVQPAIVTAYRGLVQGFSPFSNLEATQANFNGLIASFAKQKRSGVIHFYLNSQIELFCLIDRGQSVGMFGPQPLQPQHWRQLTPDLSLFWQNSQAKINVFVTGQPEPINTDIVTTPSDSPLPNSQVLELLNRSLQKLFELVCQISAPRTAFAQLLAVAQSGSSKHPVLRSLIELEWDDARRLPRLNETGLKTQSTRFSQAELLAAYEYLLNDFLEPYVQQLSLEVFQDLAKRALGQDIDELDQLEVHLSFLNKVNQTQSEPITWGELVPAPEFSEDEVKAISTEISAFDF